MSITFRGAKILDTSLRLCAKETALGRQCDYTLSYSIARQAVWGSVLLVIVR